MLQMIVHQWHELQRQIRRQHSWMLRTLDMIKAHILAIEKTTDPEDPEDPVDHGPHMNPKVQPCYFLYYISPWLSSPHSTHRHHPLAPLRLASPRLSAARSAK